MTEHDAKELGWRLRAKYAIPEEARIVKAEQRIIEIPIAVPVEGLSETPVPVRDMPVWIIRFQHGIQWTEMAMDEKTRHVVRIEKSR